MKDPSPQNVQCSAYEALTITVAMRPPLPAGSPWKSGDTFQLNVKDQANNIIVQSTTFTVTDFVAGVVKFLLTSAQTGSLDQGGGNLVANLIGGDFPFDCWKTTVGSEKRLVYGTLNVLPQQWKP